ncbi:MAG TPA: hypothetical protein PLF88_03150 [Opitutaceae bacterium]|nr:hypothetical protein [Opitutaceae bacterium]HRJ45882.1 hypothetical protein [Opitutaceae bacterium]
MSDQTTRSKPASLVSVVAIMGCFALFLFLVYLAYLPRHTGAYVGDGIRTPEQRLAALAELRATEQKQAKAYAWIDQSAGQVQLPIERAMELTVQHYNQGK